MTGVHSSTVDGVVARSARRNPERTAVRYQGRSWTYAAVAETAVVGLPDDRWIEAVTAIVALRGEATEYELIEHAREKLAHFKALKKVLFVDGLPRNASGEILKRELRDRFSPPRS